MTTKIDLDKSLEAAAETIIGAGLHEASRVLLAYELVRSLGGVDLIDFARPFAETVYTDDASHDVGHAIRFRDGSVIVQTNAATDVYASCETLADDCTLDDGEDHSHEAVHKLLVDAELVDSE